MLVSALQDAHLDGLYKGNTMWLEKGCLTLGIMGLKKVKGPLLLEDLSLEGPPPWTSEFGKLKTSSSQTCTKPQYPACVTFVYLIEH